MTWRETAAAVMAEVYLERSAAGDNKEQIAKAIDAAYPFGSRDHFPYKAWLAERREFFTRHGLPRKENKAKLAALEAKLAAWTGAAQYGKEGAK